MARPNTGPWRRNGRKTYYATIGGQAVSLGTEDLEEAKTKWHLLTGKARMGEGAVFDPEVRQLCEQRLEWVASRKKPKTLKVYQFFLGELCRRYEADGGAPSLDVGKLPVSQLKPLHLTAVVRRHPKWEGPTERGFKVAVLSLLNWAVKEGYIETNKLRGRLDLPPIRSRAKDAMLTDEDFALLLAHANEPLRDLLTACRHTGTRPNTIAAVSVESTAPVRFLSETKQIVAKVHKTDGTGDDLVVNLDETAFALLSRLADRHPAGPLFRNTLGNPWTAEVWGKALKLVRDRLKEKGIELKGRGILYGLRHNFATALLMAKVPEAHVAALGGWKSTAMIHKHYSHVRELNDQLRDHLQHIKPIALPASDPGAAGT